MASGICELTHGSWHRSRHLWVVACWQKVLASGLQWSHISGGCGLGSQWLMGFLVAWLCFGGNDLGILLRLLGLDYSGWFLLGLQFGLWLVYIVLICVRFAICVLR